MQNKVYWNKALNFNNCPESVRCVCSRTLVQHISIIFITLKVFLNFYNDSGTIRFYKCSKVQNKLKRSKTKFKISPRTFLLLC